MSKHDHPLHVECPACHHEFDVEQSLSQQIEKRLRADYEKDRTKAQQELDQERAKLAREKEALHKREQAIQDQVNERVKAERAAIEAKALKEAEAAKQEELEQLRKKAEDQRKALSDLKKEQLELMDEKEKLQNMKADLELENKRTLAKERQRIEEEVRKREEEEFRMKLREKDLAAGHVTVTIRYSDFQTISHGVMLNEPTDLDRVVYETALRLFDEARTRRLRIRLLGVRLEKLKPGLSQLSLFEPKSVTRERQLTHTLDALREKHGRDVVLLGPGVNQIGSERISTDSQAGVSVSMSPQRSAV